MGVVLRRRGHARRTGALSLEWAKGPSPALTATSSGVDSLRRFNILISIKTRGKVPENKKPELTPMWKPGTSQLERRDALKALAMLAAPLVGQTGPPTQASSTRSSDAIENKRGQRLDDGWRFFRRDAPGTERPDFDDSAWRTLGLSHDWSVEDLPPRSEEASDGCYNRCFPGQRRFVPNRFLHSRRAELHLHYVEDGSAHGK